MWTGGDVRPGRGQHRRAGRHASGWLQGTRDQVLLERTSDPTIHQVDQADPVHPTRAIDLTVLDVSWPIGQVLSGACWLPGQIRAAQMVVLVTAATVPGPRHLETDARPAEKRSRGGRGCRPAAEEMAEAAVADRRPPYPGLDNDGRLVVMPRDRRLAITGLDASPLPWRWSMPAARLVRTCHRSN